MGIKCSKSAAGRQKQGAKNGFFPEYKKVFMRMLKAKSFGSAGRERRIKMDTIALILMIVGALNWGLVGIFQFDLVAAIFGGMSGVVSRIIYSLVGIAAIWGVTMLFRRRNRAGIMAEE